MTSLSNRDCAALLRQWGFQEIGYNGGHLVMEKDGRKVQITAPSRSTPTPYKALRKAAKIAGVTLQAFLAGPVQPEKKRMPAIDLQISDKEKETEMQIMEVETPEVETDVEEEKVSDDLFTCPECGKKDFVTLRGFQGHLRAHERVLCPTCGGEFSRMGIGAHTKGCTRNKKRGPGRPRHPIAEALDSTRKRGPKDLGVEIPLLDNPDDSFPDPSEFVYRPPTEPMGGILTPDEIVSDEVDPDASLRAAFGVVLPDLALTEERFVSFKRWVEATRMMFNS